MDTDLEKQVRETPSQAKKKPEMIKTEYPILKMPKIVGKIDLDAINDKTKPKKKTREERIKDREERDVVEDEYKKTLKAARRAAAEERKRRIMEANPMVQKPQDERIEQKREKDKERRKLRIEQPLLQKIEPKQSENETKKSSFLKSLIKRTFLAKYFS